MSYTYPSYDFSFSKISSESLEKGKEGGAGEENQCNCYKQNYLYYM